MEVQQRRTASTYPPNAAASSLAPAVGLSGDEYGTTVASEQGEQPECAPEIEIGSGHYFFEKEKAKSLRGVWI